MQFQFQLLSLLAAVPCAVAAATAYTPPPELVAQVQQTDGCTLPSDYHIENFVATSNGTGSAAPLATYSFSFQDIDTAITTFCQFNSSSVSTTPSYLTPRFACDDRNVKFIWEDSERKLTLVERVCPASDGIPAYEAAGSVLLYLTCASGTCVANSTDYDARYTSLSPVRDPTRRIRKWLA